jgi:hypothetical protein
MSHERAMRQEMVETPSMIPSPSAPASEDAQLPCSSARRRWRLTAICAGVATALLLGAALIAVPLLPPRLSIIGADQHSTSTPRVFTQDYWISNGGVSDQVVDAADTHVAGAVTVRTSVRRPVTIPAGGSVHIVMTYRVTDCAHQPYGALPVSLRLDRWWGVRTITVQDHGVDFDGAPLACL